MVDSTSGEAPFRYIGYSVSDVSESMLSAELLSVGPSRVASALVRCTELMCTYWGSGVCTNLYTHVEMMQEAILCCRFRNTTCGQFNVHDLGIHTVANVQAER
eukprot:scpid84640/ scgid13602/ 